GAPAVGRAVDHRADHRARHERRLRARPPGDGDVPRGCAVHRRPGGDPGAAGRRGGLPGRCGVSGNDAVALEITGLNARYGTAHVLFDVDVSVGAGRTVALLGRNGAGKTTLLRSIA